jgi:hypothetical protein
VDIFINILLRWKSVGRERRIAQSVQDVGANDVVAKRIGMLMLAVVVSRIKRRRAAEQRRPNIDAVRIVIRDERIGDGFIVTADDAGPVWRRRLDDDAAAVGDRGPGREIREIVRHSIGQTKDDIVPDVRHNDVHRMQEGIFLLSVDEVRADGVTGGANAAWIEAIALHHAHPARLIVGGGKTDVD